MRREIIFFWENFGPYHDDRCDAVASYYGERWKIIGIEISGQSNSYGWRSGTPGKFEKRTLLAGVASEAVTVRKRFAVLLRECLKHLGASFFLCHYQNPSTFALACILRLLGQKVFVLNDSKFDDYERFLPREFVKSFLYLPYHGAISGSRRTAAYLRFLGFVRRPILGGADAISVHRIRDRAEALPAPDGTPFSDRHFTIVARLVAKKNLFMALDGYALYCAQVDCPRPLHLCGAGPLEDELKARARELKLGDRVVFHGWMQTEDICHILATTLVLLLTSTEEQFGIAIAEAVAMGLPVIASENCGARDFLLRSGVNGFVIEPDNPQGLAFFMTMLCQNEPLWRKMSQAASTIAHLGDVREFVASVVRLTGSEPNALPVAAPLGPY